MSLPIIAPAEGEFRSWPETSPKDDPMLAARGVVYAMALSLPFWLSVAIFAWWLAN